MEDNLKMIIKSESMKKHYLLLDAGCSSNKEKMESLYSLAQLGIHKGWIAVLARSSGQGWKVRNKDQNPLIELTNAVHNKLQLNF